MITSGDFEHFKESVANMRQSLKTDYGIEPLWAGCNRLQYLRSSLRSYGEYENELNPGKMARKVENIIEGLGLLVLTRLILLV